MSIYSARLALLKTPDYEMISKFPPPVSVEISNEQKGDFIKKFNLHSNSYEFNKTGFPERLPVNRLPECNIRPGKKYFIYVDLNQFMKDLDTGSYTIAICYKNRYNSSFEYKTEIKVKLLNLDDSVSNILWNFLPEYIKQPNLNKIVYDYGLRFYNYVKDSSIVGLPIISQDEIDCVELKEKLPKDVYSLFSPYLISDNYY